MRRTPTVRTLAPHEWSLYRQLRLRALADSPDAFGWTLAEESCRSDADWSTRLAAAAESGFDLALVAEVNGESVGLVWGRIDTSHPDVANVYQMWVAPSHRGLGAGRMLLEAVIEWARSKTARYVDLGVTCGDTPAMRLYTRSGFEPVGQPQPLRPGSHLLAQAMRLHLLRPRPGAV